MQRELAAVEEVTVGSVSELLGLAVAVAEATAESAQVLD